MNFTHAKRTTQECLIIIAAALLAKGYVIVATISRPTDHVKLKVIYPLSCSVKKVTFLLLNKCTNFKAGL